MVGATADIPLFVGFLLSISFAVTVAGFLQKKERGKNHLTQTAKDDYGLNLPLSA